MTNEGSTEPRVVIVGAGPAGLAGAWSLARAGRPVTVLEAGPYVGGISRTAQYKGYRFDLGGHRFFTKFDEVQRLWEEVLGPDLLVRPRLSRIYYRGRFFDYPLRATNALRNLGLWEAFRCFASYARAQLAPSRADAVTFEDWVTSRFGRRLFQIFFRTYTEKVWGIPCSRIASTWASQRIKDLSLGRAAWNALFGGHHDITSLIERFHYPRLGPGMMYERMADQVRDRGGEVRMESPVVRVRRDGFHVTSVVTQGPGGPVEVPGSAFLSSAPLPQFVRMMDPPPPDAVLDAARALRFRHMLAVGLIVDRPDLFPDNWIYIHSPELSVARIQNYGNWSPEMVPDPATSCLALEYMAFEDDATWTSSSAHLLARGADELRRTGLLGQARVIDGVVERVPDAYPVYSLGYERDLDPVVDWLRRFDNLQMVGRGGMFKYNNADHSILTALLAVENLAGAGHDLWAVNTDTEYHEVRKS